MLNHRKTIKSIETKDGRVLAPSTPIDVMPWPDASANGGWRIAYLDGKGIVKVSEHDLQAKTAPAFR